uniref:Cyclin-P3-1 isoform X1 n=2 Tax=Rhizophora mucronata TaxID=61149 RepID=A0A2P2L753_RHIMU
MGTLVLDTECVDPELYQVLGLKELKKGDLGAPRVLMLLSSLLERSVQKNEMQSEANQIKDVTVFQGLRVPSVSIQQYIDRIFRYSGCSPSCFVIAQIYVDRFLHQTNVHLTSLNVHRLLITSVLLAAKFNDDAFFNNAYYAKVGGISTAELNRLEMKFLFSIDFRLHVNAHTFGSYCYQLEKEVTEGLQIERPVQACRVKESWSNNDDSTPCAPTIAR